MRYSEASTDAAWFHLSREAIDHPVVARFVIDGEPVSKARARFTGYGSHIRSYTPEKTLVAEARMAAAFRKVAPTHALDPEATYGVTALFFSGTRQRRDVDNMLKLILDGLNGVAWVDDTTVTEVSGRKALDAPEHARTEVLVYRIGNVERPIRRCERCDTAFEIYPGNTRRFCGTDCSNAARRLPPIPCQRCGKAVNNRKAKFCSQVCAGLAKRKSQRPCTRCAKPIAYTSKGLCRACWTTRSSHEKDS